MTLAARLGGSLVSVRDKVSQRHVVDTTARGSRAFVTLPLQPLYSGGEREASGGSDRGLSIVLDEVTRVFGERLVLDRLTLSIPAGQAVAVVGRSGGGKSTLLRLLSGLDRPTSGTIRIGDATVSGLQPAVRLMFQEPRLLPWQSVIGNVGIARGPQWRARSHAALSAVGLADRSDEWPSVLSGGQRQRVALARALVDRPGVLLLDEPFSALDALTRVEMHGLLDGLWNDRGFTAVLITHDVGEAIALADRVLVLREGRIALDLDVPSRRHGRDLDGPETLSLRNRVLAAV